MKHFTFDPSSIKQLENGLNEIKGNLFEFLVGQVLAREFSVEDTYLTSLPAGFQQQLILYERLLRQHDPELFRLLPHMAQEVAHTLREQIPLPLKKVLLVGKIGHMYAPTETGHLPEADLWLFDHKKGLPVSLKLCKYNSYVNTKNAGVQSFFQKYFPDFSRLSTGPQGQMLEPCSLQDQLKNELQESFLRMGHELYLRADLHFPGHFDHQWLEAGYSDLPGELPPSLRQVVYQYYSQVIAHIHRVLQSYWQADPQKFLISLYPLCGFADSRNLQVICFHGEGPKGATQRRYHIKGLHLMTLGDLVKKAPNVKFLPLKEGISSFAIDLGDSQLQIRVKPMNKFTVPGLKVNCSVKFARLKNWVEKEEIESLGKLHQNFPLPT